MLCFIVYLLHLALRLFHDLNYSFRLRYYFFLVLGALVVVVTAAVVAAAVVAAAAVIAVDMMIEI